MAQVVSTLDLATALREEGFELPKECARVRLLMPVDGLFQLEYRVNMTGEDLIKLGVALARLGKEDGE